MSSKMIGNIVLIVSIAFWSGIADAGIKLSLLDEDGDKTNQVQVGRSFSLEVAIDGNTAVDAAPKVNGIDQFSLQETGWRYEMTNGHTTVKYLYKLIADRTGTFTVGPAYVAEQNQKEHSNTIDFSVVERSDSKEKANESRTMLRLSVDKDRAVQGEKLSATLKFYYRGPIKLRNFIEQESSDFVRKKVQGPEHSDETVDGMDYDVLTYRWDMYPQKVGELQVPAFGAEYEQQMQRDHLWGGLGRLFGAFNEAKRIYSNPLTIHVEAIPESKDVPQAIGTINAVSLSAKPTAIKKGEGAIVTLSIHGSFDPESIKFPKLYGLPESLRFYESKESVSKDQDGILKQFEYIVQGMEPGTFEIPEQQFHYFDVESRKHKTRKTVPLMITVLPGASVETVIPERDEKNELLPLYKKPWQPISDEFYLPWWLFITIFFLPIGYCIMRAIQQRLQQRRERDLRRQRAIHAFAYAEKEINALLRTREPQRLYAAFIRFFSDRWQLPLSTITDRTIEDRLRNSLSEQELKLWHHYFSRISELAYGGKAKDSDISHLFTEAKKWIDTFKNVL